MIQDTLDTKEETIDLVDIEENKDQDLDSDGLSSSYDVIVLGTGLTESIVACAIARTGRSILHLDPNDFYGRNESTYNLENLFSSAKSRFSIAATTGTETTDTTDTTDKEENEPTKTESIAETKGLNEAEIRFPVKDFLPYHRSLSIKEPLQSKLINKEPDEEEPVDTSHQSIPEETITNTEDKSSSTASTVESSLPSVSDHVEDSINPVQETMATSEERNETLQENLLKQSRRFNIDFPASGFVFSSGLVVDNLIKSGVCNYLEFQALEGLFFLQESSNSQTKTIDRVPCSKGDVFQSSLLNMFEKRALMKFLQAVADWGRKREGTDVHSLNEVDLALGRSLHRPQNKDTSSDSADLDHHSSIPFQQLLTEHKLSRNLQQIIYHTMCLYSHPIATAIAEDTLSSEKGLADLFMHLISLGRYGDGAFLASMYGIGEITQAFCRMCAVWGGIYVLRRGIQSLSIESTVAITEIENEKKDEKKEVLKVVDTTNRAFTCKYLVCNVDDWPWSENFRRNDSILTYIGIFDAPLVPLNRSLSVIPPGQPSLRNRNAVFILQQDSSTSTTPAGYFAVTVLTEVRHDPQVSLKISDSESISLVEDIIQFIRDSSKSLAKELAHVVAIRPLYDDILLNQRQFAEKVFLTGDTDLKVSVHPHFERARKIFQQICPGEVFLEATAEVSSAATSNQENQYADTDEEYDFRRMETALDQIRAGKSSADAELLHESSDSSSSSDEE